MRPLASLRVRIVAAFLAAVAMLLTALVFLMVQYQGVARSQALITEGYLPLALIVDQVRGDQQRVETDIARLLRGDRRPSLGAASAAALYGERLHENVLEARIHARQAQQMAQGGEEAAVLNKTQLHLARIEELIKAYQARSLRFVERSEAGGQQPATESADPLVEDGRALAEEIEKLSELLDDRITRLTEQADTQRARANRVATVLAALSLVSSFALLAAVLAALRPVTTLTEHVQRLALGQRPAALRVRGTDEIALLAREFDRMVEALRLRDDALTERAEQFDRLSRYLGSVLDSLDDALFVVENGTVTLANPSARELGITPDRPVPEPFAGWTAVPGVRDHPHAGTDLEVRVVPFGGAGQIVLAADVTDQRRALDRAARSERLAWIGQMLAQITHEVRNPLNAISLNAEMLGDEIGKLDPEGHTEAGEILATVSGEIERLTDVTAHYLQLARRPRARLAAESLGELTRDVERLLHAELAAQGVGFTLRVEPLPLQQVDGNQLRQALLNVIRNAVEAGGRALELSVERAGEEVHIALRDDGPGMSAEEMARAFDPFYSTKASGTGLGLAITRQILEDHDGTVRVTSPPGHGTTVTLVLPVRPA